MINYKIVYKQRNIIISKEKEEKWKQVNTGKNLKERR